MKAQITIDIEYQTDMKEISSYAMLTTINALSTMHCRMETTYLHLTPVLRIKCQSKILEQHTAPHKTYPIQLYHGVPRGQLTAWTDHLREIAKASDLEDLLEIATYLESLHKEPNHG